MQTKLNAIAPATAALTSLQRGIEKESLRISADGNLSQLPHPAALGSPLTHGTITTDFSESQLELITGVHTSVEACLAQLQEIHGYVYANLADELLWPTSMPCLVGDADDIPIGAYGSSNIGMAKTVYRRGLGVRYGRLMQTISGIHYNFSVPDALWAALGITTQDQRTAAYFALIRNFRRWSWLLIYAFGASPAVCKSFTRNIEHNLQPFDEGSMHLPYATSLRMGSLGYQSDAQTELHISYNSLNEYAASMVEALTTEYPPYAAAGTIVNGEHQQLNTAILQIENEFYGTIRPKRTIHPGERPVTALRERGVEYVEVRCIDLNPFLPLGIDAEQIRFIDSFLLMCLLADSENDSIEESKRLVVNQRAVVECGREPGLTLQNQTNQTQTLTSWADELLSGCEQAAATLDAAHQTDLYAQACATQRARVDDPNLTPSAQVLAQMRAQQIPFFRFAMNQAVALKQQALAQPLTAEQSEAFRQAARDSLRKQADIEAADSLSFADFLTEYLAIPD